MRWILVGLTMLLLAACGGSGGEETLSREEYLQQSGVILATHYAQFTAFVKLTDAISDTPAMFTEPFTRAQYQSLGAAWETSAERIGDIEPPDGLESLHDQVVALTTCENDKGAAFIATATTVGSFEESWGAEQAWTDCGDLWSVALESWRAEQLD